MSNPISNPTKTLQIEKSSSEINEAIAFIPALSAKYKIASANPEQQMYTLRGSERGNDAASIDLCCSSTTANKTAVRLEVRRTKGLFNNGHDALLTNQHINALSNLLSDSLALNPIEKSRLLSSKTNNKTAGEHRRSQTIADHEKLKSGGETTNSFHEENTGLCCFSSSSGCSAVRALPLFGTRTRSFSAKATRQ